jgi:hypothetical protein
MPARSLAQHSRNRWWASSPEDPKGSDRLLHELEARYRVQRVMTRNEWQLYDRRALSHLLQHKRNGPRSIRFVGKLALALLIFPVCEINRLPRERLGDPFESLGPALARLRNKRFIRFRNKGAKGSAGMSRPSRRRSRASDNLIP